MFLTLKPYLHLNCVLMLNWIIWNRTVFDIKTVFTLNWIITYNCLNSLRWKFFWQLNCVLMLNWIVLNRTDYLHKMDLALNNLQRFICHKTQQTNQPTTHTLLTNICNNIKYQCCQMGKIEIFNHFYTWNHLTVCKQMISGLFKNVTNKLFIHKSYLIIYKQDLALNN